jgi:hypothetical protein
MIYENHAKIEEKIRRFLNNEKNKPLFNGSPRTVGDCVEEAIKNNIGTLIDDIEGYEEKFARRSMADFAFEDADKNYYVVDVKTHNLDTVFNMPNLTSVQRIAKLYRDSENHFCLLKIDYKPNETTPVEAVHFLPIEHLDWSCLTLGALGWGQIQIANANKVTVDRTQSRKKWMLQLCDALAIFYPAEMLKIEDRINFFATEKKFWEKQPD